MQVILQENFSSLGFVGDVVNVKVGFARNYLFPQKIALPISKSNVKLLEHRKRILDVKKAKKRTEAEQFKAKIERVSISVSHAAEGDRLFGSVSISEIHDELKKGGLEIDRKLIKLEAPIKTLGEHVIDIKLHQDVTAHVKLKVEKLETKSDAEEKPVREKKAKKPSKKAAAAEEAPAAEAAEEKTEE